MKVIRQIAAHLLSKGLLTSKDRAFLLSLGYEEFEYPRNDDAEPPQGDMTEEHGSDTEDQETEAALCFDRKGNKRKGKKRRLLRRWWKKKVA